MHEAHDEPNIYFVFLHPWKGDFRTTQPKSCEGPGTGMSGTLTLQSSVPTLIEHTWPSVTSLPFGGSLFFYMKAPQTLYRQCNWILLKILHREHLGLNIWKTTTLNFSPEMQSKGLEVTYPSDKHAFLHFTAVRLTENDRQVWWIRVGPKWTSLALDEETMDDFQGYLSDIKPPHNTSKFKPIKKCEQCSTLPRHCNKTKPNIQSVVCGPISSLH